MNSQNTGGLPYLWRKFWILPIRFYQNIISPLLPPSCIYHPTCSHYAAESVMKNGAAKGIFFGLLRILRCNGLFLGGADEPREGMTFREATAKYGEHYRFGRK